MAITAQDINNIKGVLGAGGTNPLQTAQLVSSPKSANAPINTSMIGTTPVNIPQIPVTAQKSAAVMPAPMGTLQDANGQATIPPPAAPVKTTSQQIKEQFGALGDQLATKSTVTQQLQDEQQLAKKTQQATQDYNTYNQAKVELQQRIEGMHAQAGGTVGGNQQAIDVASREGNANLANLAVQAQASQGLLASAQQTIKDKLEAQFQPIQDQIDYLTKFAALNNNDLTESEQFKLTQLAKEKETDSKNVQTAADDLHQAVLENAPANVRNAIYTAMDKVTNDYVSGKIDASQAQTQLYQAVGPYGVNPLDKQIKQAQLDNIKSEIAARKVTSGSTGGLTDPSQVLAYAQQYASNGQIPPGLPKDSFGIVSQVAKELPQQPGTIVDANTGVKSSKFTAAQSDAAAIMKDLADRAATLKTTYNNTSIFSTNSQRQQYNDQRNEMVDLLARLRSGAAISQSELDQYQAKLPVLANVGTLLTFKANLPSVGNQKIDDFASSVTGKLNTALQTSGQVMYGFSTVKLGGNTYKVGDEINVNGTKGRVLADGTIAVIK